MTLTASLLLDLVLLGLLLYCVIMGVRRGLILSLCSLLAVVLALCGGWYLASHYAQPLQEHLTPSLEEVFLRKAEKESESAEAQQQVTEDAVPEASGSSLPDQFSQALQESLAQPVQATREAALTQLAAWAAGLLAKALLFLAGFLGVLILWLVLCHALNLVAKLPGLHFLNKALGGVLGLAKGLLLLLVAQWVLCTLLGWIPQEVAEESRMLALLTGLAQGTGIDIIFSAFTPNS